MAKDFVTVKGKKYYVEDNKLSLRHEGITDISEIEGLKNLNNLKELDLSWNKIKQIKGLEQLTNLQKLDLSWNRIKEIDGLENLENLQEINLNRNPLRKYQRALINASAQEIVKYCQDLWGIL